MENGFSSDEATDVSDSEVDDYVEKSYMALRTGNHGIHNQDDTFRYPFCPGKMKLCYQFKDLFQHATGIIASNSRKSSLKAQHRTFTCFLQHDLAYPLPWEDLKATVVGGVVPAIAAATNSEPPPKEELFIWPWMVVLVNADPSDAEGEANTLADQLADFHPTDDVFLYLKDEKGGRSTGTTVSRRGRKERIELQGDSSNALHGWLALSDDYNEDSHIGRYLRKYGELKIVKQITEEEKKKNG
ncbi:hypothetical protein ZIOFF_054276 [Zingiber officinale]|uniref:Zinc finger-XS domain-containing protein n=1 Tax=Zingiber officinale TaxID=94328 RepID=A0A8J5FU87_ZINOF|nr:hypothetical protein ZIOFF_054276 [Zingiber officinale]